jgi:hypothetical protein
MIPTRTPASPFSVPILRSDEFTAGSPNWQEPVKDFNLDKTLRVGKYIKPDYSLTSNDQGTNPPDRRQWACDLEQLQTVFVERAPSQAPKTSLKLFAFVPSLLQAHPFIDAGLWVSLGA